MLEHYMIAKVIYAMMGNKFVVDVDSNGKYVWFEFVLPGQPMNQGEIWKWRKEVNPDELHIYISENFSRVMDRITEHIKYHLSQPHESNILNYYKKLLKAFERSKSKIFNDSFKRELSGKLSFYFAKEALFKLWIPIPTYWGLATGFSPLRPSRLSSLIIFTSIPFISTHTYVMCPLIPKTPGQNYY